ncbi:hypothetical protein YC2023_017392 [Brassica napus]
MAHTGQTYNRRRPWPLKLNLPGTFCIPLFLLLVKTSLHRFSKKEEASQFSRQRCSQQGALYSVKRRFELQNIVAAFLHLKAR